MKKTLIYHYLIGDELNHAKIEKPFEKNSISLTICIVSSLHPVN